MLIHKDFLNLVQIEPSLMIDMKYSYDDNFIGAKINGYKSNTAYLKSKGALLIKKAQEQFLKLNMSLVVYDAYRPQKASEHFYAWCQDSSDQKNKEEYYPNVDKKDFLELGYIGRKSQHTRGIAIDVSLFDLTKRCVLDMGGCFDLFDKRSHTLNSEITNAQLKNRLLLKNVMEEHGFDNFYMEWWHYFLKDNEVYQDFYDFDVE